MNHRAQIILMAPYPKMPEDKTRYKIRRPPCRPYPLKAFMRSVWVFQRHAVGWPSRWWSSRCTSLAMAHRALYLGYAKYLSPRPTETCGIAHHAVLLTAPKPDYVPVVVSGGVLHEINNRCRFWVLYRTELGERVLASSDWLSVNAQQPLIPVTGLPSNLYQNLDDAEILLLEQAVRDELLQLSQYTVE